MPMSNTTAAIQASNLETFFRIKRPDLQLTQTTIAQQLQAITTPNPTSKTPPRQQTPSPSPPHGY